MERMSKSPPEDILSKARQYAASVSKNESYQQHLIKAYLEGYLGRYLVKQNPKKT